MEYSTVLVFIFGLIFGSFMNVLIYRLPLGQSIVFPSSFCPSCKNRISFYDNIPLLSYIILMGKCRKCGVKISLKYPVVELITALVFAVIFYKYRFSGEFFVYTIFAFLLMTAAFTDLFTAFDSENFECGVIPSIVLYITIAAGVIGSFFTNVGIINSIIGTFTGYLILFIPSLLFKLIAKKEGMGDGDFWLLAGIGSFVGYKPLFFVIFISSLLGAFIGIFILYIKKERGFPIPFGPFLSFAAISYVLYGKEIVEWYLNLYAK